MNQSLARKFFPAGGAIGKRWTYGDPVQADSPVIVGVVQDAKYNDVRGATPNMIYRVSGATPVDVLGNLEVRTSVPPATLTQTVRQTLAELEPALAGVRHRAPRSARESRADERSADHESHAVFGVVALLLACLGLYGTISYGVARRVSELGLRMALGADRPDVAWLVIKEALTLVAWVRRLGCRWPTWLAAASCRSCMGSIPSIPSLIRKPHCCCLVAGIAAYLPAHRASRIDPMAAFRSE